MQLIELSWNLVDTNNEKVIVRYCKNCGKTVEFKDSFIRRHNSNGKNIYRYAIYKCDKDHTWNKKLSIYKAYTDHAIVNEEVAPIENDEIGNINVQSLFEQGVGFICIKIIGVSGVFRLDKLLAERLECWSRTEIVKKIKDGTILVNNEICKPSQKIILNDLITVKT